jgi:xanthine dehydrogenase accessory factor
LNRLYEKIIQIENSNQKAALCTIVSTQGSSPRKTGAKMLVMVNGTIVGTIGGGALEKKVIAQALESIQNNSPRAVKHNLVADLAMCCGGTVELFIEPIMNRKKLYIFGCGHIGKALAGFADALDFSVSLIDARYDAFEDIPPGNYTFIQEHHIRAIEQLEFDEHTLIVILTHDHAFDREILALTSKKKHLYIGMIGSERKVLVAKKNLVASGIMNENEIAAIDMPIGIDIEAITPQEIAISILARLIDIRNRSVKKTDKI